jgi:hypothetical protein
MPRETREERDARLAREEAAAQVALEAYLASVPKRLMEAQALANSLYVSTSVTLGPAGPIVHFEYESEKYKVFIDSTLTYQTEEWELESLESQLAKVKEARDEEAARLKVAQTAWEKMTPLERTVIKEFIYQLR